MSEAASMETFQTGLLVYRRCHAVCRVFSKEPGGRWWKANSDDDNSNMDDKKRHCKPSKCMYFLKSGPIRADVFFCSREGLRGCTLNTPLPKGTSHNALGEDLSGQLRARDRRLLVVLSDRI